MNAAETAPPFPPTPIGGLFDPASMMWKISRERIVLIGGPAAAVLQVAHPAVARGVAEHSDFRNDAFGRLRRTLRAVYAIGFGSGEEVEETARRIEGIHRRVRGDAYSAFDADLQMWVLATLIMTGVSMYETMVAPLTGNEKEDYFRDMRQWGRFFGLEPGFGPQNWNDFEAYYQGMIEGPLLGSDPLCGRVAGGIVHPENPLWLNVATRPLGYLVTELIPSPVRERLGLHSNLWTRAAWSLTKTTLRVLCRVAPDFLRYPAEYRRARIRRG